MGHQFKHTVYDKDFKTSKRMTKKSFSKGHMELNDKQIFTLTLITDMDHNKLHVYR